MFKKDNHGQLSLEYLLIIIIILLIFTFIVLPIGALAVDFAIDTSSIIESKNEVSKIATAIDNVYLNGKGSKRTLILDLPENIVVDFSKSINLVESKLSFSLNLSNGQRKQIEIPLKYSKLQGSIELSKGYNKIIVHWVEEDDIIQIYKVS
ncbi:hypothetical protein [Methanobrevibacter filiformis]|uniref:Class III signal peptide n=1 Tax=Methanobrevibacter filiformis TaxID=55758 RepID=A0A166FDU9_9EURY|nr:hypothetical protein [Methanobrevibacter filiformis]KZX17573.1 hypothetical protein MBFIL_00580 [Methanobrevibacter filiformis]